MHVMKIHQSFGKPVRTAIIAATRIALITSDTIMFFMPSKIHSRNVIFEKPNFFSMRNSRYRSKGIESMLSGMEQKTINRKAHA